MILAVVPQPVNLVSEIAKCSKMISPRTKSVYGTTSRHFARSLLYSY